MFKFLKLIPIFMAASAAGAQTEGNMRDIVRIQDNSFMVVFPFENHRQYAEFSNNKKILTESFKQMNELKLKVEAEKDQAKKEEMAKELMQKTEVFQANDDAMRKAYNFTSGRSYIELFLTTYVCTPVSEEEFSTLKFKDGEPIDPLKIVKAGNQRYYRKIEISGFQNNQDFQGTLAFVLARRMEMSKLREQIAEQTDMDKVTEITTKIADIEKALKEKILVLKDKYGITTDSKYMVEIDKARLLLMLTPEELIQMQANKEAQPVRQEPKKN